jgi:NADPH2:quinone reductase
MTPRLPVLPLLFQGATLRFFSVYELPEPARRGAIGDLTAMMRAGRLRHTIAARFPLREIAAAHEAVESGRMVGNVLVDIDAG